MTRDQAAGLTLGILTGALLTRWWAPRLAHAIAGTPRQTHATPPQAREHRQPVPGDGSGPGRPAERRTDPPSPSLSLPPCRVCGAPESSYCVSPGGSPLPPPQWHQPRPSLDRPTSSQET